MSLSVIVAIAYGLLAIIGGIMGYTNSRSKISLIAGVGCGLLLIIGGILQLQGQAWGVILSAIVTAILVLAFIMRLIKTRKFMPAGLMLLLGIPALLVLINAWWFVGLA